MKKRRLLL